MDDLSILDFLRKKYRNIVGYDTNSILNEWESVKAALQDYSKKAF